MKQPQPGGVVSFWSDAGHKSWFGKDERFDAQCRTFEPLHHAAARGELQDWADTSEGALGLCLLLDQIPRNIYRGSAHAFATDGLARSIAERALAHSFDTATELPLRIFFYLPLEHAEDLALQQRSVFLFEGTGDAEFLKYAVVHRDIIARFGRFPHRNAMLGRTSSAEELAFLAEGGFAG